MGLIDSESNAPLWRNRFFKFGAIVLGITIFTVASLACSFFLQAVLTVILTAFLTFILSKPVAFMERKGIPRPIGTTIGLVGLFALIIFLIVVFIPPIVEQVGRLIQAMPGYIDAIEKELLPKFPELQNMLTEENFNSAVGAAGKWLEENGGNLATSAFSVLAQIAGGIGYAFGIVFVSILTTMSLLNDLPQLGKDFMSLFNKENQKAIGMFSRALGDSFYGWLMMMIICGFVFGVSASLILDFIGVPYAFVVGVLCSISFFIPGVGPIIASLGAALAGLCNVWWMAIVAFIITFAIATVIQMTLMPTLTASRMSINPGFGLFAGMVGGIIWGPIGLLIGVPIYAAIQAIIIEYYREYKGVELATPESKLFIQAQPVDGAGFIDKIKKLGKKDKEE